MFLRATIRKKDGKEHTYYSVVENKRLADGRVAQQHMPPRPPSPAVAE